MVEHGQTRNSHGLTGRRRNARRSPFARGELDGTTHRCFDKLVERLALQEHRGEISAQLWRYADLGMTAVFMPQVRTRALQPE